MKEYDLVELMVDRDEYKKEGVTKGMFGAVMSEKSENGKWLVVFSEFYTGNDIADFGVREEDLKVHEFMPPDRIPPPPKGWK
jgi:hypothetical protein